MPSHYFIKIYEQFEYLNTPDIVLIENALNGDKKSSQLVQIGEVILNFFCQKPIINSELAETIYKVSKFVCND